MEDRWSDEEAARCVARYAGAHGEALALRTYSSRLIGAEPGLVLHGGGNTSVKDVRTNLFGEEAQTLLVKASGVDLAAIEPEGHVALWLTPLQRLRELPDFSDEAMINELRAHMLDHGAPNPSIETLVHAFVPGAFKTTGSDLIRELHDRMVMNRRRVAESRAQPVTTRRAA